MVGTARVSRRPLRPLAIVNTRFLHGRYDDYGDRSGSSLLWLRCRPHRKACSAVVPSPAGSSTSRSQRLSVGSLSYSPCVADAWLEVAPRGSCSPPMPCVPTRILALRQESLQSTICFHATPSGHEPDGCDKIGYSDQSPRLERHFRDIDSRSMQACLGSLPYATQAQDRCASAGLRLPAFRTAGFSDDGAISPKSALR